MAVIPQAIRWRSLQQSLRAAGQRRLVVLAGERATSLRWLVEHLPELSVAAGLWSGPVPDCPHPSLTTVSSGSGRQWLGRETELLVWDGWQGNPPDSLAAFSGILAAGGLWFWLMPPLAEWQGFDDPDYARTGLETAADHPFAARLARLIAADPAAIHIDTDTGLEPEIALPAGCEPSFQPGETDDQAQAVQHIVRVGRGRRRRPLVITADRGRGKSAALGMAAIELLRSGRDHIAVTAPSAAATDALFQHAGRVAGGASVPTDSGRMIELETGASLRFYPLDELLRLKPEASLVMVDEAAAIPAPMLRSILLGWPRVVFASTVHGYEGAGRGFALRFRRVLNEETPQWRAIQLERPIRWAVDDPLEALVNRLYLLDAQSSDTPPSDRVDAGPVSIERWVPAHASEADLAAAFGLLVDAHYRTTPGDLRQWLDDPDVVCWLARASGHVVGVLWLTIEGGLSAPLARQVMRGERRIRGHLLPQSLANHSGFDDAATLRLGRIVRVAVSDSRRRQGLGQQLVAAAQTYAGQHDLDGLGTSFGASPDLLAFWHRCELPLVRLGLHREASSGEYAVQMLLGLSERGRSLVNRVRGRLAEHWLTLLPVSWPTLSPELALTLTALLPEGPALTEDDLRELNGFGGGFRGFELSLLPLQRLARRAGVVGRIQSSEYAGLWCRSVLQGWSWSDLQAAGECSGRREAERRLRVLTTDVLAHL